MKHFNVHFSEVIESTRLESMAELKTAMQQWMKIYNHSPQKA